MSYIERSLNWLFKEYNRKNIVYCILRNYQSLPDIKGTDIDILIDRRNKRGGEFLLKKMAKQFGWSVIKPYSSLFGLVHLRLFRFERDIEYLYLDFYYDLSWFGGEFLDSSLVLSQRKKFKNFYIASPEHESYINFMNAALLSGKLKDRYIPAVKKHSKKPYWDDFLKHTFGKETPIDCRHFSNNNDFAGDLRQLRRTCRIAYIKNRLKTEPIKQLSDLLTIFFNYCQRLITPPGFFLAILGPDGVGKSTVIEQIEDYHKKNKIFNDTCKFHLRPRLFPDLSSLLKTGCGKTGTGSSSVENKNIQAVPGIASSFIRLCYYSLDYILGYWIKIYPQLLRGRLVIFDRYFYDYFVDIYQKKIGLPWNILKIFSKVIPKPDLVVLLTASPETIIKRKQDVHQIEEIGRQLTKFKKLSDIVPNFAIIENIEKDSTVLSIFRGILSCIKLTFS